MKLVDLFEGGERYQNAFFRLYDRAFPETEKKPKAILLEQQRAGIMELLAICEEADMMSKGETERPVGEEPVFVGLAIHLHASRGTILDYFAIDESQRQKGLGSQAIRLLTEHHREGAYILEVERLDPNAPNALERERRRNFYLKNGLLETGIFVNVYQVDFELLSPRKGLTYETYLGILKETLGEYLPVVAPHRIPSVVDSDASI